MPKKLKTHSARNLFIPIGFLLRKKMVNDACYQYRSPFRLRIFSMLCFSLGVECVGVGELQSGKMSLSCALENSCFVSAKEFPLAILVKLAEYVIK